MIRMIIALCLIVGHFECAAGVFDDASLTLIGQGNSCGDFLDYKHEYGNASETLSKFENSEKLWSFLFNERRLIFCDETSRASFKRAISLIPSDNKRKLFDDLLTDAINLYEIDNLASCEKHNICTASYAYIKNAAIGRAMKECENTDYDCLQRYLNIRGFPNEESSELAKLVSYWGDGSDLSVLASLGVDKFLAIHPELLRFFDKNINIENINSGLFLQQTIPIRTMVPSWKITLRFSDLDRAAASVSSAFDYARKYNQRIYMYDYEGLDYIFKRVHGKVRNNLISSIVLWGDSYNFTLNSWTSSMCVPKERDSVRRYVPWLLAKRELLSGDDKMDFDLYLLRKLSECYGENELRLEPNTQHLELSRIILEDISRNLTLEQIRQNGEIIRTLASVIPTRVHSLYPSATASAACYSKFLSDMHHLNPQGNQIARLINDEYANTINKKHKYSEACGGGYIFL